ncbi:MAG: PEP-CTERM sorting domain-containing protein [Verrucomicrobia bacterium]|nr:MAG: PEP-CTERM sorting domain-containing protein [Verrucomicrobiota bacterium]
MNTASYRVQRLPASCARGSCLAVYLVAVAAFTAVLPGARAFTTTVNNINAPIPDGDLNGYQNSVTVSGLSGPVAHTSVMLDILGGFNGDYYAYLYHNGVSAILLNRVGLSGSNPAGYSDPGFGPNASANPFTLDDLAAVDVHRYQTLGASVNGAGQVTGLWQPDGRAIDPTSPGSVFDTAARSKLLGIFNGMDPNGVWTLYVVDASAGFQGTLVSWGLTVVPEPGVGSLGLLAFGMALCRLRKQR